MIDNSMWALLIIFYNFIIGLIFFKSIKKSIKKEVQESINVIYKKLDMLQDVMEKQKVKIKEDLGEEMILKSNELGDKY